MKKQIYSETFIAAPAASVWTILAHTAAYSDWNPFIRHVEGSVEAGAQLRVTMILDEHREVTFKPRLIRVWPQREIRWIGRAGIAGLFDGEHSFALESDDEGTRFIHQETFTGVLVPFLWPHLKPRLNKAFAAMNARLKARAEAGALVK